MEFPAELFQTLNDDAVKVLPANMENSAMATGLEKVSFQANPKECSDYHTVALISQPFRVPFCFLGGMLPNL